jgi:hypothetical protein
MENEGVPVTTVAGEEEAEVVCGLLRSFGLDCGYRATDAVDSPFHGIASDGPQEVLVHPSELEQARAVLADAQH